MEQVLPRCLRCHDMCSVCYCAVSHSIIAQTQVYMFEGKYIL